MSSGCPCNELMATREGDRTTVGLCLITYRSIRTLSDYLCPTEQSTKGCASDVQIVTKPIGLYVVNTSPWGII